MKFFSSFNLTSMHIKKGFNETVVMPRMLSSEIFLISFVVSLWLLSVLICLKRYSLFICHHKRDVPFYDASLINVKLNLSESPTTPDVPKTPTSNQIHHVSSSKSGIRPVSPTPNQMHNSCTCGEVDDKGGGGTNGGGGNGSMNGAGSGSNNNWNSPVNNQNSNNYSFSNICTKCNLMKQSMSTNLYYYNRPYLINKAQKSFSNGNFYKQYYANYQVGGPHTTLTKNRYHLDFSNDYFYSNGVMYPNPSRTSSSLMSKVIFLIFIIYVLCFLIFHNGWII
jgi:hypothetical protein